MDFRSEFRYMLPHADVTGALVARQEAEIRLYIKLEWENVVNMVTIAVALLMAAPDAPARAPAAAPAPKEKKICRLEVETGSITPHRTCMSKAEWARLDGLHEQAVQNMRDRRTAAPMGSSNRN